LIVLIETTARFGKTTTANHLKITLNGSIVFDEPRCQTKEQIDSFMNLCTEYSKVGDVIIAEAGDLLYQTNGAIMEIADIILVGKLNDKNSINILGLNAEDVYKLNPGEFIKQKESDKVSQQLRDKIVLSLNLLKQIHTQN
jgi:hypothetical protein